MITIVRIAQKHGYSGNDHLLDDGPLQELVGREFRSVKAAKRAANAIQAKTQDRRCANGPIRLEVQVAEELVEVEA